MKTHSAQDDASLIHQKQSCKRTELPMFQVLFSICILKDSNAKMSPAKNRINITHNAFATGVMSKNRYVSAASIDLLKKK